MTPIEIALEFVRCGFYVFPLYKGKNGQKLKPYGWARNDVVDPSHADKVIQASKDPEFVKQWNEVVAEKYDSTVASFGVLGIDCVILDIDCKNGKDGISQFQQMMLAHDIPKPSMLTTTKSGGLHAYYKRPANYRDSHVKTLSAVTAGAVKYDAIDLRGNGGFVVGPDELIVEGSPKFEPGKYITRGPKQIGDLPEFPEKVLKGWLRTHMQSDLDNLVLGAGDDEEDYKAQIRKGRIPSMVPLGARNESFWLLINVLKSKGVPIEATRQMCAQMAKVVEEPETLCDSVNIEEILSRVYIVNPDNPYDVAVDLINCGLFQLTGYKSKLHYVVLEENPYVASKIPHDESTMKTLLAKYQKVVQTNNNKPKVLNPMEAVTRIIHDENRADTLGFKPNAGQVFSLHDDPGAKRFLNTYKPIPIIKDTTSMDLTIWDEFTFIVSRIFGAPGTAEYQLGLDFIAWLVQRPQLKPAIAPFIMSHQRGVGKSLLFNMIIQILGTSKDGERQGRLTKLDEITGRFFNPSGCLINLIDEVQFPVHRDTRKESVTFWRHLKNLITAETISVEIKGGATYQVPNSAALLLAGNTGSHFPIEEMDRRLWIIDANPPLLEHGVVDRLFMIVKGQGLGHDDRVRLVNTIRYMLYEHRIENDLSSIRAPMTDVKRDIFMNSLTDIEDWFIRHFEDEENLFAATPVITESAFIYVAETSDKLIGSKWREDTGSLFRDMKRRGYLRPIRAKGNSNQSRNIAAPIVGSDGVLYQSDKRGVLYTTRDHGKFDDCENKEVIHAYMRNTHTVKRFKGQIRKSAVKDIYTEAMESQEASDDSNVREVRKDGGQ